MQFFSEEYGKTPRERLCEIEIVGHVASLALKMILIWCEERISLDPTAYVTLSSG